jgi:hypothetical protein
MRTALRRTIIVVAAATAIGGSVQAATGQAVVAQAVVGQAVVGQAVVGQAASPTVTVARECTAKAKAGYSECFALRRTDRPALSNAQVKADAATPFGYSPTDLQSAYALTAASSTRGAGQRVFIIDAFDDPNAESDLAVYRSQYGLPACTTANGCFAKINQNGATSPLPASDEGWGSEITLDVDMVSAICPKCGITLVEATDNSDDNLISSAVTTAVGSLGAKYVSMSFGGDEFNGELQAYGGPLSQAGVVYTASTGDDGYGAQFPAVAPNVVAVGGTTLNHAGTARGWSETAWADAGSGCSAYVPQPAAQVGVTGCVRRAEADISAEANPQTGVSVYDTFGSKSTGWEQFGGTSASAPMIAAMYALVGSPSTVVPPPAALYSRASSFNDVTSGSNGSCPTAAWCHAAVGWDGPTGLGTPNGLAGLSPATTVTVTNPGAHSFVAGAAVSVPVTATASDGSAISYSAAGLPSGVTINAASGLISGAATTAGSYAVTVTAKDVPGDTGTVTFTLTITPAPSNFGVATTVIPNGIIGTHYATTLTTHDGKAPYKWSAGSALPKGLTLSSSGQLSGVPSASGTTSFVVNVTDASKPANAATATLSLTVPALTITTASLPSDPVDKAYPATTLKTDSGKKPIKWSLTGGALPPGLKLSTAGGLTGTPTAPGTYSVTISAADSSAPANTATRAFQIVITPMTITTASLAAGVVKHAYSTKLAVTGGKAPLAWKVGAGLPPGLKLSAAGILSGTPTTVGSYTFTVTASDATKPIAQTASATFTITIT